MLRCAIFLTLSFALVLPANAQPESRAPAANAEARAAFSFALFGSIPTNAATGPGKSVRNVVHSIETSGARLLLHFQAASASDAPCGDAVLNARKSLLESISLPAVPIVSAIEWSTCDAQRIDPAERLNRVRQVLFSDEESAGRSRLRSVHQGTMARFHRFDENLRWQLGPVLFVTLNVPANNNNFRIGAGRNGEFEERIVANRIWLENAFRAAAERSLRAIVIAIDADPRFDLPSRGPDSRSSDRDGYYELKSSLRDLSERYAGQVLLVQGNAPRGAALPLIDRPVRDLKGRTLANVRRIAFDPGGANQWLRVIIDVNDDPVFRLVTERLFDDPSGELYGPARVK